MNVAWFNGVKPLTKFAPTFKVPLGIGTAGDSAFVRRMTDYILKVESDIIVKEELVSSVPKSDEDPYKHTQQWKQHNLLDDIPGLGGENLTRFPSDPVIEELFQILRTNYLEFLAALGYPRRKVYVHAWANVLRSGEWISKHRHITSEESYLAGSYYLTTNNASLFFENPLIGDVISVETEARKFVFFPSWLPHWSDKVTDESLRISLAFDLVTEASVKGNPWRPHRLLDDPDTMQGLIKR
jgi:hypothetical protein